MSALDIAVAQLQVDEGFRAQKYVDTTGHTTIGYGFNVDSGISQNAALALLNAQAMDVKDDLALEQWYISLDPGRQSACIQLAFNLGIGGFLGFQHMIDALRSGNWQGAHDELLDSKAAQQLPARYSRLAACLLTGAQ